MLSSTERKNGWQLADFLGEANPNSVQHLPARVQWDTDAVRDDLLNFVAELLGQPDGVLVVNETGFLKPGTKSMGVGRQSSSTAGRIEHCPVGVFLGYVTERGWDALRDAFVTYAEACACRRRRCFMRRRTKRRKERFGDAPVVCVYPVSEALPW